MTVWHVVIEQIVTEDTFKYTHFMTHQIKLQKINVALSHIYEITKKNPSYLLEVAKKPACKAIPVNKI